MGFCFSCCRRSRPEDREPLLPRQVTHEEPLLSSRSQVDKLADVLAALQAGKLPSQDQTNAALRRSLRSDVLAVEGSKTARVLGQGRQYGPLSERGQTIVKDVREVIEAVIQFGMEKNGESQAPRRPRLTFWQDDDRIQDLIYQNARMGSSPITVNSDAAANHKTVREISNLGNYSSRMVNSCINHASQSPRSPLKRNWTKIFIAYHVLCLLCHVCYSPRAHFGFFYPTSF